MHSKVEYIVAHGISTTINGEKAIIGSYHFVFEDENSIIPEGMEEKFRHLPEEYSHLYLALEGVLAAVICIEDPLRPEAAGNYPSAEKSRSEKIVMMTGDSERTAKKRSRRRSAWTSTMLRYCRRIRQTLWRKKKQRDVKSL